MGSQVLEIYATMLDEFVFYGQCTEEPCAAIKLLHFLQRIFLWILFLKLKAVVIAHQCWMFYRVGHGIFWDVRKVDKPFNESVRVIFWLLLQFFNWFIGTGNSIVDNWYLFPSLFGLFRKIPWPTLPLKTLESFQIVFVTAEGMRNILSQ